MNPTTEKNGFTALRLLAATLVFITHSTGLLRSRQDYLGRHHWPQFSELAVDSFFVISGYLICLSLLRNPDLLHYIRNRSLRIFPGLSVAICMTICIIGPLYYTGVHYWADAHPWTYLWNITLFWGNATIPGVFLHNPVTIINGSLWTLSIEMLCYIGLFLLSWFGGLKPRTLMLLLTLLLFLHYYSISAELSFFEFHTLRLSLFFVGGALLATLKNKLSYHWLLILIATASILYAFSGIKWPAWQQPLLFLLLWPYLIIGIAENLKFLHGLNRFDCSYGIYIYAFPVQQGLIATVGIENLTSTRLALLTAMITIPIALLSWYWVEKPALQLKNQFRMKASSLVWNT